jgi:hypothetical protein
MREASAFQAAKPKRSFFGWLAVILMSLLALFAAAIAVLIARFFWVPGLAARELRPTQAVYVISELRMAILSYQVDYNHFPIPESASRSTDAAIRSSGPLLPALVGKEATALNPRFIKFYDGPFDSDSEYGLWHDGNEWVLRDRWGEAYYLMLDTNDDNKIANPDPAAAQTAPEISESVLIYSAGPDRDPKTWQDNVCSWLNKNLPPSP